MANKVQHYFLLSIGLLLLHLLAIAQTDIPIGTWRTHFSYNSVKRMVIATDQPRIYAATPNTLFYLDQSDNSINKLTKLDGLSDAGISALHYNDEYLAVGYQSGVLDFIKGNEVVTFKSIAEAPQLPNKSIAAINIWQNRAYVATSAGVIVINLQTFNILESYTQIGRGASNVNVSDLVISGDSIFLATNDGLLIAQLSSQRNLQDFNNWSIKTPNNAIRNFTKIAQFSGGVALVSGDQLWEYQRGNWRNITPQGISVKNLYHEGGTIYFVGQTESGLYRLYDSALNIIYSSQEAINQGMFFAGKLYIASDVSGIKVAQTQASPILLNGPHSDNVARLTTFDRNTYLFTPALSSMRRSLGNTAIYSVFNQGVWSVDSLPSFTDLTQVVGAQAIFSSFGKGIYQTSNNTIIDDTSSGSPLISGSALNEGPLITDLKQSADGGVWVANYDANPSLHYLKSDGTWESIVLGNTLSARYPLSLTVSSLLGNVWVQVDPIFGGGIFVYSPTAQSTRYVSRSGNNLPSNAVNAIAVDLNDEVWIGTDVGVAYFPSSSTPFSNNFNRALIPIFDGDELLRNQFVSCIAIDGGNRKWIGTRNGVWVFSENAENLEHRFTSANSPLASDTIFSIAIDDTNGEVFIASAGGVVSYRSDASKADDTFSAVKVFPNPVPPDYNGLVGIEGLGYNVSVKITNLTGQLVRELQSNGGSVAWDVRDVNGAKISTGTYLIFSSSADGSSSFVGKFSVVR